MPVIGKDIAHDSAVTHVTGESVFLDDMPPLAGELLAGIVPFPLAHGKLKALDLSDALAVPGVAAILTATDIPGHNLFGPAVKDELLIVEDEAVFLGQPVCGDRRGECRRIAPGSQIGGASGRTASTDLQHRSGDC